MGRRETPGETNSRCARVFAKRVCLAAASGRSTSPTASQSNAAGDVYVAELPIDGSSKRVQKFSPTGEFLAMFGGEVNKTSSANVCRKADIEVGDVCGAGVPGTADGFFSYSGVGNNLAYDASTDTILAGDQGRIQRFETDGTFKEEIEVPGKSIEALATDSGGNLYVAYGGEEDVHKLSPAGAELMSFPVPRNPLSGVIYIAVNSEGDLYTVDSGPGKLGFKGTDSVLEFDAEGNQLLPTDEEREEGEKREEEGKTPVFFPYIPNGGPRLSGLAANFCEGSEDPGNLYLSFTGGAAASYVKAYGTAPIGCEPPPVRPPIVSTQYAAAAGADSATLQAKINPLFWPDTTYRIEYGTGKCSEGGCPLQAPASDALLTERSTSEAVKTAGVPLTGLESSTTYHYRFVAESDGGGPEYGLRPIGEESVEGSATSEAGREGSFRTLGLPAAGSCPGNEAFRTGLSAQLPDCRAYELVSPLDKENGDAALLPPTKLVELNQSALSGDGFTYSSLTPFADPEGSPFVSQYLAWRDPGAGWSNEDISPPRSASPLKGLGVGAALHNEFKAFSGDLCNSWIVHVSLATLAAEAVPGYGNLYRREGCGGTAFEALSTEEPRGRPAELFSVLGVMGFTADEAETIFVSDGALADAPALNEELKDGSFTPRLQLYINGPGGLRFACHQPSSAPAGGPCGAGLPGPSPDNANDAKGSAVQGALSADGSRLYWAAYEGNLNGATGIGRIYLTTNPDSPQSAHLHGSGAGKGDLAGPAVAKCNTNKFAATVIGCQWTSGDFGPGQSVSGPCIAAETTVESVVRAENKMTLSKKPTVTQSECEITGLASATVRNVATEFGAFGPEQEFIAPGVPAGTTIEAAAGGTLTLSAQATKTTTGAAIEATSECTEAGKACTTPVSEPVAGEAAAEYWGAAKDGSKAIYRVAAGPLKGNVYEFDSAAGTSDLIAEGGLAPMGMSEDASRVYFASSKLLGEGASEGAEEGADNLYLYQAPEGGGEGSFSFIMGLVGSDLLGTAPRPGTVNAVPTRRTSTVSPDGLHAAFGSGALSPTGYDNADAESGEPDQEVYLYDAASEGLLCASCNPSGARPRGLNFGSESAPLWVAARLTPPRTPLQTPRNLSDNGGRLFFESRDKLVPRDNNGTWDVYEWEAPGEGDCTASLPTFGSDSGGCVDLISSGRSPSGARFLDADPSGSNVFIGTQASLIKADYGLNDVYDARIGGGFPEARKPPAGCEGEACQSPAAAPQAKTPASSAFRGPGDLREARTRSCRAPARQARRTAHRARRLAHRARRLGPRARRRTAHRAHRAAHRARRLARNARRCRRANRKGTRR